MASKKCANTQVNLKPIKAEDISPDMSFLEMLDVVNESLIHKGEEPIHFDHDCREGICGMCSLYINGQPARAKTCYHYLPAAHAQLSRWRNHYY